MLRSLGFLPSEAGSHREGLSRGATMTMTALAAMWRADRSGHRGPTSRFLGRDPGLVSVVPWNLVHSCVNQVVSVN